MFEIADPAGNSLARVGVPASKPDAIHMVIPRIRDVNRAMETGFAMVNAGDARAEVTARLYSGGKVIGLRSLILEPKRQTSQLFYQLFGLSEAAGFSSWTHVDLSSSTASLAAVALLLEGSRITSVPVSLLAALPKAVTPAPTVDLFAAQQVDFGQSGGRLGSYVRTASGQWEERNTQGQVLFRFLETGRDRTSVYLEDRTRNVSIQIDLSTRKIIYSDAKTAKVPLYDVVSSSTTAAYTTPVTVAAPDGSTFYFLQTKLSQLDRKCLEGNEMSQGSSLGGYSFMADCSLVTGQLWKFVSLSSRGWPGYYQLTTYGQQDGGLCLESGAYDKSTGSGTGAYMANCSGQLYTGQMWKLLPAGDGFKLQSKFREESNQCLESNKALASSTLGGASFMDTCADVTGEIWTRTAQADYTAIPDSKTLATPVVDPNTVNGFNVEQVQTAQNGKLVGSFFRTGALEWKERDVTDKFTFTFAEIGRDEWSVYLKDTARGVGIQIDMFRKKIIYTDPNNRFDLHDIVRWATVTGYTGQQVYFGNGTTQTGAFFQTGATSWKETDNDGKTRATFTETGRDAWSVYLRDPSRNFSIQLDLFRKKLVIGTSDAYDILSMAPLNGYTVQQSTSGIKSDSFGGFVQTGPGQWKEINALGQTAFTFTETGRDDWSVYMRDASRSVSIQIDLFRKKVVYSDPNNRFDLYDVIRATVNGSATIVPAVDLHRIRFVGSSTSYDLPTLKTMLSKQGLTLVNKTSIKKGECAIIYKKTDKKDISASGGVLACEVPLDDGARLEVRALYGGCDVADVVGGQGVGSNCEAGLGSDEITVDIGSGASTKFKVAVAEASECTALSVERTCAAIGVDLVSAGVTLQSERGSSIGLSAAAGVGGRFSAGYEDGTFSIGVCGKALIGACIDLSVNKGDVEEVYRLGETAYLKNNGKIVAVGNAAAKGLTAGAAQAIDAGGQVITTVQNAGKSVLAFGEDVGQKTTETVAQARQTVTTVAATAQTQTGRVVTAVAATTKRILSFLF